MKEKDKFIPISIYIFGGIVVLAFIVIESWLVISSNKSFSFNNYEGTFKAITFFIAVVAIVLTFKRMAQTRVQIDIISDNVKFNNFYKHRDEFVKYLSSQPFISNLAIYAKLDLNELLLRYHGIYYTRSYKNFNPEMDKLLLNHIRDYLISLSEDETLSSKLEEYIGGKNLALSVSRDGSHYVETLTAFQNLFSMQGPLQRWKEDNLVSMSRLKQICQIYYDYKIKVFILLFAGETFPFAPFVPNLDSFFIKNELTSLRLE